MPALMGNKRLLLLSLLFQTVHFCFHLLMTLGLGFGFTLAFEVPMLELEKIVIPPKAKTAGKNKWLCTHPNHVRKQFIVNVLAPVLICNLPIKRVTCHSVTTLFVGVVSSTVFIKRRPCEMKRKFTMLEFASLKGTCSETEIRSCYVSIVHLITLSSQLTAWHALVVKAIYVG